MFTNMKHVIWIFFAIAYLNSQAQIIDELPQENGKINFNEVVQVDSASKDQLHFRAKQFFADSFKSANDVIQMDDKAAGILVGKAWSTIFIKVMGNPVPIKMWYTVKVQSREGRYKAEVYDIYYGGGTDVTGYPEQMFDKKNYYKSNGNPRDVNEKYKIETLSVVNGLLDAIQIAMKKKETGDKW